MSERIFGIEVEKLEKSKCYLTLRGAKVLGACSDATDVWEARKWGKLEAAQIVHRFAYCCPACFCFQTMLDVAKDYIGSSVVSAKSSQFLLDACTCVYSHDKTFAKDEKKELILHIRALIIRAFKYKNKLEAEYDEMMREP